MLWKYPIGSSMINEIVGVNPEESIPCLVMSNNDTYVLSASGGKVSLFTLGFKRPVVCWIYLLHRHPASENNNITSIGLSNSSIQIYDVRCNKEKATLSTHKQKVTGLAFAHLLQVLVTCGQELVPETEA